MKDIKSFLIGVFATTCLFLFMGQSYNSTLYDIDDVYQLVRKIDSNLTFGAFYKIDCDNLDECECSCGRY